MSKTYDFWETINDTWTPEEFERRSKLDARRKQELEQKWSHRTVRDPATIRPDERPTSLEQFLEANRRHLAHLFGIPAEMLRGEPVQPQQPTTPPEPRFAEFEVRLRADGFDRLLRVPVPYGEADGMPPTFIDYDGIRWLRVKVCAPWVYLPVGERPTEPA